MWSLYNGLLPYVRSGDDLLPHTLFPHYSCAAHAAHPHYIRLAQSCLQKDPHQRPSFTDLTHALSAFFFRNEVGLNEEADTATSTEGAATAAAAAGGPRRQQLSSRRSPASLDSVLEDGSSSSRLGAPTAAPAATASGRRLPLSGGAGVEGSGDAKATTHYLVASRSLLASGILASGALA